MGEGGAKSYCPVSLDLVARLAVVIGSGEAVEKRARALVELGADVAVVTPDPTPALLEMEGDGLIGIEQRSYVRGDLEGAFLAFCVDRDDEVRRAVAEEAEERGCPVNVSGDPSLCSFIMPSVVRRGGLQIAVSTGGASPEAAHRVRRRIAEEFGQEWASYVALLGEVRELAAQRVAAGETIPGGIFETIADSDLLQRLRDGEKAEAAGVLDDALVGAASEDAVAAEGAGEDAAAAEEA